MGEGRRSPVAVVLRDQALLSPALEGRRGDARALGGGAQADHAQELPPRLEKTAAGPTRGPAAGGRSGPLRRSSALVSLPAAPRGCRRRTPATTSRPVALCGLTVLPPPRAGVNGA